ncbi:MAG: hypothetical protein ACFFDT_20190 [Candidatus Hodarchaeota archaeon]
MSNLKYKKSFFFVSLFFISILMLASINVSASNQASAKVSESESVVETRTPATVGLVEAGTPSFFDPTYERLTSLGFSVTNISLTELNIGNFSLYDVVYLPSTWALSSSDYADIEAAYLDFRIYVSSGGGLVVEQPAPSLPATPTILPYPVTFDTSNGLSRQVVFSGHPITEGLADGDMPYPWDTITSYDTDHYLELAENPTGGAPTLLVLIYGSGKIVVHTANINKNAAVTTANVTITRMVEWAAGELVFSDVSSRILFDDSHDGDGDELSGLYQTMNATMYEKGFMVGEFESGTINPTLLADYGILIILDIEIALSSFEITTIQDFVDNGNALLYLNEVAAFCYYQSLGDTLSIYGIGYNGLIDYDADASNFTTHPITQGVSIIDYAYGDTLEVLSPAVTIIMDDTASNNPLMAVYKDTGRVVAIGDSNLWDDTFIGNHNNSLLLNNTLDWLKEDAPTVTVDSPNGGESLSETETLSWTASDADGDSLTYSVYYSADNGTSWAFLISGLTNTSIDWDTTTVPDGEDYLIKVVVSDGTLTAEDQSDEVFTIDNAGINWALYGAIGAAVFFALLAIIILIKKK